jgi:hypothetical protein
MEYKYELFHWGIKGMRWGVRRYQNDDGTLTDAGIKRYNRDADERGYDKTSSTGARYKTVGEGKKQRNERLNADAKRYVQEDMERTQRLTNETGQLANKLKSMTDSSIKNNPKQKMDLSNMTDKEMRDQINRALLERQYNDMFAPQKTTKGREYVSRTLDVAGSVLGVTSTALGVALAIKQLSGK